MSARWAHQSTSHRVGSPHRTFTRRQAADLNFDRRRVATAIRGGWLDEPVPGVLVMRDAPATWEQRLMTVVLATGGHGVASHRTAARLLEFDGLDGPGNATLEASVTRTFALRSRSQPSSTTFVHSIRATSRP